MARSFPADHGMTSFWRSQPHALDNHRSTEILPESSDIVIIGSGYAGTSTAYHCLQRSQSAGAENPSIVILEARQACSGATGRNGGHLRPDLYSEIHKFAEKYGFDAASEVAAFESEHLSRIQSLIEKESIDCDLDTNKLFDIHFDPSLCEEARAGRESLISQGLKATESVHFTPLESAETVSGVKGAKGCFQSRTGRLWPYKLVTQLLSKVVSAGVNLQTYTPVLRVSDAPDADGRWTVVTDRGSIQAKWVVFATNAYTSAIAPDYKGKIVPVRGVCSRIVVPNPPKTPLECSYTMRFNTWDYDYLIPRPDGSIIVGGAKSTFFHDASKWYDNTDDSRMIEAASRYFDNYMQRNFHGWENTGAYTDRVWTGIMGFTTDSLPHVGNVPHKPGQLIVAGFSGHGMPQVFLSAEGIARMIVDGAAYEETGLPRLFRTSSDRLESEANDILGRVDGRER
ncbi:FAD dependent oxidoreductase superfamily [Aspergillus taichungensis]|uniref:FAD dependent oxidoreductase superfamily n=1 Tax=Aspergillus taichungensis TaxID=482145 RepID=A0A2J5I0C6_9EURO|nr:FAD dependent oxidoreductase superfamily [Aspergillus taichungensis]